DPDPGRRRKRARTRARARPRKARARRGRLPYFARVKSRLGAKGITVRYDPDPDFDPEPARRRKRKAKGMKAVNKYLMPVGLIYGFLNGINKTANPTKWGNTINNISNPKLPASLDEYVTRLKGNLSFLLGIGGYIYSVLPTKLPVQKPIQNLSKGLVVGGAVGSVLDPPSENLTVQDTNVNKSSGIDKNLGSYSLVEYEKLHELEKPIYLGGEYI
ncbi:MAG: hypothetical protein QXE51_05320, partial [Nitrososphaeria archaeon]